MIPEYKLYHGAVLAELVHALPFPVKIDELAEEGRLRSYILDSYVGLHVKHSASRMHPWSFTFTTQNLGELETLIQIFPEVFVVFVCGTQGMVCLPLAELAAIVGAELVEHPWVRIDKRPGKWFQVAGPATTRNPAKYPNGIDTLVAAMKRVPA